MPLTVTDVAAINRVGVLLAPHVTNGIIDGVAKELGFSKLQASNKADKVRVLLSDLAGDGRSRSTAGSAIATLVMAAHQRTVAGNASLSVADVDRIVEDMRALGLPPGDLARSSWRKGLATAAVVPQASPVVRPRVQPSPSPAVVARRHDQALKYIAELTRDHVSPQHRGRELEKILTDVLTNEGLSPTLNIVNPGEQLDLAFVLGAQHYLTECRWHADPQGMPAVRDFSAKVARKAVGTFGVLISMSGFASHINATASQGSQLNCVGLAALELMRVLEGMTTFSAVVQRARASASTRSLFYDPE